MKLDKARTAFAERNWVAARDAYASAPEEDLAADDLAQWSEAAWWMGLIDECISVTERAYDAYLAVGNKPRAADSAFTNAYSYFLRGDEARGGAWLARAEQILNDIPECVEHGYMLYFAVESLLAGTDQEATVEAAHRLREFAERHGSEMLMAGALMGEGRALIKLGRAREGVALVDDAMLRVASADIPPTYVGNMYCHMMSACHELADIKRAATWTQATAQWCDLMSPAVLFRGICRMHRAQILQVLGDWDGSAREAQFVCETVGHLSTSVVAEGHYQAAEILRLRGEFAQAEAEYTAGHALGRDPQPGLALLRLAQGRVAEASASVRAALAALSGDRLGRVRPLSAQAEIALAAGDLGAAEAAAAELAVLSETYATSGLEAAALSARGAVRLARGDAAEALPILRSALTSWLSVDAAYDAARVRLRLAQAYRSLGDEEAVKLELDAAETVFESLRAVPDLAKVAELRGRPALPDGLSAREAEVLALVASGLSNRDIADALTISQKTVARHLSNIFVKIGVSSRTAAGAYAFQKGLASPPGG